LWIISGLRSHPENHTAPAALFFMNMVPALELLVFMSVVPALELYFFMAPASIRFHKLSHINISVVLVCLKLNGK